MWVKTDDMKAAFPEMAEAISGPQPGQIMMENAGAGWQGAAVGQGSEPRTQHGTSSAEPGHKGQTK